MRLAAPFEALRDRSDAIKTKTGTRPKVFLANLGTAADFTARATFAKSFFETGGIEAVDNESFADPAKLAAAFKNLEEMGFSQEQLRVGTMEILQDEEWGATLTMPPPAPKKTRQPKEGAESPDTTPADAPASPVAEQGM